MILEDSKQKFLSLSHKSISRLCHLILILIDQCRLIIVEYVLIDPDYDRWFVCFYSKWIEIDEVSVRVENHSNLCIDSCSYFEI